MEGAGRYSLKEEIAHSATHGLGIALSLAGLVALLVEARQAGDTRHLVAAGIYGVTLFLLYLASTLYHAVPVPRAKRVLRVLDHSAIYLLIAGTYTPVTLITLGGGWGWSLFGVVWGLAVLGITLKVVAVGKLRRLSIVLYLIMGWLVLVALGPLSTALGRSGIALFALGGVAYTLGVPFYVSRRPYNHAVWHLFVLAGSVLHFFAVLLYVLPGKS